jgi:branched-chain amino acid transport system substrate-binding protein
MACKGEEKAAPAQTAQPAQPAQPQKVLKVGCISSFSNKEGLELKKWNDLIAKVINARGGLKIGNDTYKLDFITYDATNDPAKARTAQERLIFEDGCKLIGNFFGGDEIQAATICEDNKVLGMGSGFRDDDVKPNFHYWYRTTGIFFARGFHYLLFHDYFVRGGTTGVVVNPESEGGHVYAGQIMQAMQMAGLKTLGEIYYPADTVDFAPIATKVKTVGADVVDLAGAGGDQAVQIISNLKDVGWKGLISPSSLNTNQFTNLVQKVGKEYLEGTEQLYFDPRGIQKDPTMLKWLDEYTKEYGEFVETGAFWCSGWWFLQDAMQKTGSVDPEVLRNYMDNSKNAVMTLDGYSQLFARPDMGNNRTVDVAPGHGIGMIKDGKLAYWKQVTVEDQYLASIKAYGLLNTYQKYWDQYGKPTFPAEQSTFTWDDLTK